MRLESKQEFVSYSIRFDLISHACGKPNTPENAIFTT